MRSPRRLTKKRSRSCQRATAIRNSTQLKPITGTQNATITILLTQLKAVQL
ncbi:MAG: hypothetical protein KME25_23340 [Symplocastrum torsivum CPER-KK1]|uniref:Uncharacterized protein n=1 Tax=Symplocastrum torsivum CPER-KK1 TaxID=450513 RepID=A0A951UBV5_9CYAN|nr:hypothetical protein [Symplocastrum torsivum CPER-KK1]